MNSFFNPVARFFQVASMLLTFVPLFAASTVEPARPGFELKDGDRVAFIGDTFVEREQAYGFIESRLTARFFDRKVIFRNLGWSGDTPGGQSRVSFDWSKPQEEWFAQLMRHVAVVKPTVVILGYGMANSFDGPAGVESFRKGIDHLIDSIRAIDPQNPARFLILGPIPHEVLPAPFPDPSRHNADLALYNQALKDIATKRGFPFVSLFDQLQRKLGGRVKPVLTDNGIHLNAFGYKRAAESIESALGFPPNGWRFGMKQGGELRPGSGGIEVQVSDWNSEGFKFRAREKQLMTPFVAGEDGNWQSLTPQCNMQFFGLRPGYFILKAEGVEIARGGATDWSSGRITMMRGPLLDHADQLRQAIIRKNELYFHRWRPQNETYLFGFRKHEQGQNAREIPMFDPLIAEAEAVIDKLKQPVWREFEMVFAGEVPADADRLSKPAPRESRPPAPVKTGAAATGPGLVHPQPRPEFDVAPGFEVNLYAENPLLAKPVQINFDPQGRLWVASSAVYPQIQPGERADDKIVVLEDVDHDGVADKSTVFADGLLIPTGVEPGDGGAYVGQSTELLFFKDTDGDGRADLRKTVLSGFGTEDTHHILHTLHWGMDGRLYMNQSIYIHSHIETPHGVRRLNSGGVWRFDTRTHDLEVFLRGFCNPWGHDFDAMGQSFVTDGAGFQGVSWGVPGAMYFTYAGGRRLMDSISPGTYPKFCGLELVSSRQFPEDWQGNAITCDYRAHRVVRFSIHENGSGYSTQQMPDLLRSTNVTFRPIDVKFGPDGALYIADWSNPIIQHGEVDFRDPRRDRVHGRIWRVKAKGRPADAAPPLPRLENLALMANLLSPDGFLRQQSRRVLTERGDAILKDLDSWTARQTSDQARLEALWMYQSIDRVPEELVVRLVDSKHPGVRAAATRVLGILQSRVPTSNLLLASKASDESGRVRVEAARALSRVPSARAAETVLGMVEGKLDPFLDYALWLSINDLATNWLGSVESGAWKPDGRPKQFEFALRAIEPKLASRVVGQYLKSQPVPADGTGSTLDLIAQAGGAAELRAILDQASGGSMTPAGVAKVLKTLAVSARTRQLRPQAKDSDLAAFFASDQETIRLAALELAGAWKEGALVERIAQVASRDNAGTLERLAAVTALREIGGRAAMEGLKPLLAPTVDASIRVAVVQALAGLDLSQTAPLVIETLQTFSKEEEALAVWRTALGVRNGASLMLKNLPKTGLTEVMARAGTKAARESGRNEPELVIALARGANLNEESQPLTDAEMKALVARVASEGDPVRGEMVYRRPEFGCVNCHAIGGAGGKVGPDMTSIGASAPVDYLIESLLFPNRKVKEGYHSVMIETRDDEELSGILVRETGEEVFLRDINNREFSVPKSSIKARRAAGSLMPSGLVDSLTPAEQIDMYRFLSELGKPGGFDASKANVARLWRLRTGVHTMEQFGEDKFVQGAFTDKEWTPVYTLVDGRLPAASVQQTFQGEKYRGVIGVYAASRLQTARAGQVRLSFDRVAPQAVWLNGKAVAAAAEIQVELPAGTHNVVVKLDARKLPPSLRLSSDQATFIQD